MSKYEELRKTIFEWLKESKEEYQEETKHNGSSYRSHLLSGELGAYGHVLSEMNEMDEESIATRLEIEK